MKKKLRIVATLVAAIIIANSLLLLGKTEAATNGPFDLGYNVLLDGDYALVTLYRSENGKKNGAIGLRGDAREVTDDNLTADDVKPWRNEVLNQLRLLSSDVNQDEFNQILIGKEDAVFNRGKAKNYSTVVNVRDCANIAKLVSQKALNSQIVIPWWADANMDKDISSTTNPDNTQNVRDAAYIARVLANKYFAKDYETFKQRMISKENESENNAKYMASMAYPFEVPNGVEYALLNGPDGTATGDSQGKFYTLVVKLPNKTNDVSIIVREGAFIDKASDPNKETTIAIHPNTPTGTDDQNGNGTDDQKGNGTDDQKGNGTGEPTKTPTETPASDKFEVTKIDTNQRSDGNYDVVVHTNKELDPDKLPDGWKLCDDKKSVTKVMAPGAKEDITLVAKTGEKANASVSVPEDKKKDDLANKIIAKTGESSLIIGAIAIVAIAGTVFYIKSK